MSPNVVSGVISTVAEIGRDEAWLRDWLREQPARMGLGELRTLDGEEPGDPEEGQVPAFWAVDDGHLYSVDVRLGELEAAAAFGVLQGWAASRSHEPDKEHVAVLVTERLAERYRSTLTVLAEHLPLLVVGLSVWRGENEALVVPHVALASTTLDLSQAPAVAAAASLAAVSASLGPTASASAVDSAVEDETDDAPVESGAVEAPNPSLVAEEASHPAVPEPGPAADEEDAADAEDEEDEAPMTRLENRDDTGIVDPWRLSSRGSGGSAPSGIYSTSGVR
jgi:hypothetical protein